MGGTSVPVCAETPILIPSGYAADRLLRLRDMIMRQHVADQMLHGPERALAHQLLSRALFSLYLDCREAGVADEAQRLLTATRPVRPAAACQVEDRVVPSGALERSNTSSRARRQELERC